MKASDNNPGPIQLSLLPLADQGARESLERRDGQGVIPEREQAAKPDKVSALLQALYDAAFNAALSEFEDYGERIELFIGDFLTALEAIEPAAAHQIGEGLRHGEREAQRQAEADAAQMKARQRPAGGQRAGFLIPVGDVSFIESQRYDGKSGDHKKPQTFGVDPGKPGDDATVVSVSPVNGSIRVQTMELKGLLTKERSQRLMKDMERAGLRRAHAPFKEWRSLRELLSECGGGYDPGCAYSAYEMREHFVTAETYAQKQGWTPLPEEHPEQQHFGGVPLIWERETG